MLNELSEALEKVDVKWPINFQVPSGERWLGGYIWLAHVPEDEEYEYGKHPFAEIKEHHMFLGEKLAATQDHELIHHCMVHELIHAQQTERYGTYKETVEKLGAFSINDCEPPWNWNLCEYEAWTRATELTGHDRTYWFKKVAKLEGLSSNEYDRILSEPDRFNSIDMPNYLPYVGDRISSAVM